MPFTFCNISHPRPPTRRNAKRREMNTRRREAVQGVLAALSHERRTGYGRHSLTQPQEAPQRPAEAS
jgi:hypothetical protein